MMPPVGGYIALTHDGWTSCATESYDTITALLSSRTGNYVLLFSILPKLKAVTLANIITAERLKDTDM